MVSSHIISVLQRNSARISQGAIDGGGSGIKWGSHEGTLRGRAGNGGDGDGAGGPRGRGIKGARGGGQGGVAGRQTDAKPAKPSPSLIQKSALEDTLAAAGEPAFSATTSTTHWHVRASAVGNHSTGAAEGRFIGGDTAGKDRGLAWVPPGGDHTAAAAVAALGSSSPDATTDVRAEYGGWGTGDIEDHVSTFQPPLFKPRKRSGLGRRG